MLRASLQGCQVGRKRITIPLQQAALKCAARHAMLGPANIIGDRLFGRLHGLQSTAASALQPDRDWLFGTAHWPLCYSPLTSSRHSCFFALSIPCD